MEYIEEYANKGKGKRCAILGGGTSLPHDLRNIPDVDVLFGVNQHSLILPLDYIVFIDAKMHQLVKDHPAKIITRCVSLEDTANTILVRQNLSYNFSGCLALLAADIMQFDKVYVCGFDQYDKSLEENYRFYWWEGPQVKERQKERRNLDSPNELKQFLKRLSNPERVFFVSGRMKELHQ